MQSPSMLIGWPWRYKSSGAREPERQPMRAAGARARLRAMGQRLALVAAVTLGTWLLGVPPSGAFHDSALDPQSKQALAGLLEELQDECRAGNREACAQARQVQAVGNRLAQTQQACARGDERACRVAAQAQQQLAALLEQTGAAGMDSPSPRPSGPTFQPPQRGRGSYVPTRGPGPQDDRRSPLPSRGAPEQDTAAEGGQRVKLGPLTLSLGTEDHGSFTARARGEQVIFSNPDDPNAISFTLTKTQYPSPRVISVTVTTDVKPVKARVVGTGIVYAFRGSTYDDSSFYAVLLTGDGAVTIARRTPEGSLQEVARFSNPRIAPAGRPNVLTVSEETLQGEPSFAVAINGESLGSFGGGTVGPGGWVGIAYSGIGNHGFEDLEIRTAQPHAAPPAPDEAPAQRRGSSGRGRSPA